MTLPINARLMMVAETLDNCAEAIQHDGGDVMIAIQIQEEARVLREMHEELGSATQLADELEALADDIEILTSDCGWLVYDMRYKARVLRDSEDRPDAFSRYEISGDLTYE